MPLTQAQLVTAVAERTHLSKSDAKRALAALDEVVLDELGNAQKVRIGGLVQLTVRVKPPQKPRKGHNPATGEEITVAAKPASIDLRARPLARAKGRAAVGAKGAPSARCLSRLQRSVRARVERRSNHSRRSNGAGCRDGIVEIVRRVLLDKCSSRDWIDSFHAPSVALAMEPWGLGSGGRLGGAPVFIAGALTLLVRSSRRAQC